MANNLAVDGKILGGSESLTNPTLTGAISVGGASDTVGFYGAAAAAQPTSGNEAAVAVHTVTTASTTTTPAGYATTTQANSIAADLAAVIVLANQMRADLVTLGLIKGS